MSLTVKQSLLILASTTITALSITVVAVVLWNNHPEYLGLPPLPPPPVDSLKVKAEIDVLKLKNDSLERIARSINDSLRQSISALSSAHDRERQLNDQLLATKADQEKKDKIARDSTRLKNMQIAAEMYEKAQPAEVAKILAGSEPEYVAHILKLMKRKSAAKVLEQLPTKKAVEVTKHLAKI